MKQGKCSGEINNIGLKPRHSENILVEVVLHRSSRNFNPPPPPPRGKPRAFDYFLCPGSGEFDLCLGVVGKIEPGAEVANSYKHVFGRDGIN